MTKITHPIVQYHPVVWGDDWRSRGGRESWFRLKLMIVQNSNEVTFSVEALSYFLLYTYLFSAIQALLKIG
jgi:hypothetical protein